jgi:hypothetical protein
VATINARDGGRVALTERVARNVDHEAVERAERERTARVNAERREFLYDQLFRNVFPNRDVESLRTEAAASEMLSRAVYVDNRLQVEILRLAVDNQWSSVVEAFVKHWAEHPIAYTVLELWTLTRGRDAV